MWLVRAATTTKKSKIANLLEEGFEPFAGFEMKNKKDMPYYKFFFKKNDNPDVVTGELEAQTGKLEFDTTELEQFGKELNSTLSGTLEAFTARFFAELDKRMNDEPKDESKPAEKEESNDDTDNNISDSGDNNNVDDSGGSDESDAEGTEGINDDDKESEEPNPLAETDTGEEDSSEELPPIIDSDADEIDDDLDSDDDEDDDGGELPIADQLADDDDELTKQNPSTELTQQLGERREIPDGKFLGPEDFGIEPPPDALPADHFQAVEVAPIARTERTLEQNQLIDKIKETHQTNITVGPKNPDGSLNVYAADMIYTVYQDGRFVKEKNPASRTSLV